MKKILTSLALLGAMTMGAYAQTVDLSAQALMIPDQELNPGVPLSSSYYFNGGDLGALNDSIPAYIGYGIDSAGGTLPMNDTIQFLGPWSVLNADSTMGFNIYADTLADISADTGYAGIVSVPTTWFETTDSINTLLNIPYFDSNFVDYDGINLPFINMVVRRADLVNGNTYGWYTHVRPYPSWDDAPYVDTNHLNNWAYIPVIWQGNPSGLTELLNNTHYTPLEIYPNPTTDQLSFKLNFDKANKYTVARILDLNGRALSSKYLGSAAAGTQQYSVDVSALPAGMYSIQVITERTISVEKFVKK